MKKIPPFRIWDRQHNKFETNGCGTHCFSQWMIDVETGKLFDATGALSDKKDYRLLHENPSYYMDYYSKKKRKRKMITLSDGTKMSNPIVKMPQYVLQRFTGLKDKNKKPIYEGDIVAYSHKEGFSGKSFVTYYDVYAAFGLFTKRAVLLSDCTSLEVIGNKMENPELLK